MPRKPRKNDVVHTLSFSAVELIALQEFLEKYNKMSPYLWMQHDYGIENWKRAYENRNARARILERLKHYTERHIKNEDI